MSPDQEEEFAELLIEDKKHDWRIEPDESQRLRELVRMLIRGAELEPEEEKELCDLHRKANRGIGSTTPG